MSKLKQNYDLYLTTKVISKILRVSENTLKQWRILRKGPQFVKFGARRRSFVRYPKRELFAWIDSQKAATAVCR